jgi:hypothetical protein
MMMNMMKRMKSQIISPLLNIFVLDYSRTIELQQRKSLVFTGLLLI